jgi:uncharacterized membrane protein YccC
VIGAIFVITNGIPAGTLDVGERTLWFAAGSLVGLALMVAAYAREGSTPGAGRAPHDAAAARQAAPPLPAVLAAGARQLRRAVAHDSLLRAHVLRLASIVTALLLLARLLDLDHGYWVPLTVLAVLQPEEHASDVRAVQRAAGTLVGTALIAVIAVLTGDEWVIVAAQGVAAFGLFALFARGYFWLVVLLTPTALLTVSAVDYEGVAVALQRAGWSALGIVLGLAIAELFWRLPSRESRRRSGTPSRSEHPPASRGSTRR